MEHHKKIGLTEFNWKLGHFYKPHGAILSKRYQLYKMAGAVKTAASHCIPPQPQSTFTLHEYIF